MCANLSVLGQLFGKFIIFIFPCVFHLCCITANLHACLGPAFLLGFVGVFFHFSKCLSTQNDARTDLVQDQLQIGCAKKSTHFHLDHFCTFVCSVVSMSAQSVGGDEISVLSPVGVARAAAILVGALEAGDLMGETPRGKKARYAEPTEQNA